MNKIPIILALLFLSNSAVAQTQGVSEADLNKSAPESPVQVKIPHSERTRGNILDAALDFLFIRFFNRFEGVDISYDFFEIDAQRNLAFKNFKIKVMHSGVKGDISFSKVLLDLSEFMETIKNSKMEISKIVFEKTKADLVLTRKKSDASGQQKEYQRRLNVSADELILQNFLLAIWDEGHREGEQVVFGRALTKNAKLSVSNPNEKYFAASASMKDISVSVKHGTVRFSSAEADGKKYDNLSAFLKAVKQ